MELVLALQQYNLPLWILPLAPLSGVSKLAFGSMGEFDLVWFCFRDFRGYTGYTGFCITVNNIYFL